MANAHPAPSTLFDSLHAAPGDRTAAILPESGVQLTYEELREQVLAVASDLAALGIRSGCRVATALPNGLPAMVTFLAASIAGTAAPLNPAYRVDEFRFYLEDTNAQLLLCPAEGAEEAVRAADGRVPVRVVAMDERGRVRIANRAGHGGAGIASAPTAASRAIATTPAPEDVALILHTSGSTGRPKRVPLRHRNLTASARNIVETYALSARDVSLCVMPLFHVHGLVASTLSTLLSGGTVIMPEKFSPLSFWKTVRAYGATWYSAVPTIHNMLLSRAGEKRPEGCERLRFIRSCSAALAPELMQQMESRFGAPVLEAYGMTEAAHQMCSNPLPPSARLPGSVGRGTGIQVAIMDGNGKQMNEGERGEIVIRGPSVISGYENNPSADAQSFVDGWFRTGDQGFLDHRGYLSITGRIKELINRGGEKIAPREIDEVLLAHPAVAEAVTFGIPHASWGEEVVAAVVLREPQKESAILAYCRQRLADFKCPKKLYVVTAIPRTATGKIQRGAVARSVLQDAG